MREWAYNQGAAKVIEVDAGRAAVAVGPVPPPCWPTPEHPAFGMGSFHHLPQTMAHPRAAARGVPHRRRAAPTTSTVPECAEGIARGFEPWMPANLLPVVLPALDGVVDRLRGRCPGRSTWAAGPVALALLLATTFPASDGRAATTSRSTRSGWRGTGRSTAGVANASFLDPRESPLPADGSADLVTTFDCIHDMTDPAGMIAAIRAALADDGTWLLVDIKAQDTFAQNVAKNPMASLMYGISVLSCMSSALSEPGGAGLGTLGLSAAKAEALARDAGFTRFRRVDIDHPVNAFYEIRP